MGFIERLRQRKAAEELKSRQQIARAKIVEKSKREKSQSDWREYEQREAESKKYFKLSGLEKLFGQFTYLTGYELMPFKDGPGGNSGLVRDFGINLRGFHPYPDYPENGLLTSNYLGSCVVLLHHKSTNGGDSRYYVNSKMIAIEVCPDGSIHFYGGIFGSSKVALQDWQTNKGKLESALEKSYRNPKMRRSGPHYVSGSTRSQYDGGMGL